MTQITMNKELDQAELMVDTAFYGFLATVKTAKAFTKGCYVHIEGDPLTRVIVTLKPKHQAASLEVAHEFYNYMLKLINQSIREYNQQ